MMAVKESPPYIPKLLIVNVPPWYSSGFSLFILARLANSRTFPEMATKPLVSAAGIIGVISPEGVATATQMSTVSY